MKINLTIQNSEQTLSIEVTDGSTLGALSKVEQLVHALSAAGYEPNPFPIMKVAAENIGMTIVSYISPG